MGVTGLWRLVEPAGKPVPVETLENKVLAVDISIWLHQMVKGYQDARGAPLPNAHLIGLFQRLCKLLYFRIRPVFVFDGGFPDLKRETIAKRQDNKNKYHSESARLQRELALLLSKQTAVNSLLGKQISPKKGNKIDVNDDDLFKLPAIPQRDDSEESESEDETSSGSIIDLHSVDVESNDFKNLPVKEKYDMLVELKETRKMNSWGRLHELPKKSENFSDFQMERLLKRRKVQECLQETEKEMGDAGMSLNDLESLLNEEGIDTKIDNLPTKRIASNNTTRYLLINDVKQALAEARKKKDDESAPSTSNLEPNVAEDGEKLIKKDEYEEDLEMAIKMSMECVTEGDTSVGTSKTDDSWTSFVSETDYSDSDDEVEVPDLSSAKAYIMQYSDLTNAAINNITHKVAKHKSKAKSKRPDVNQIINELNNEKIIIDDYINLSSSDEDEPHSSTGDEFKNKSSLEINSSKNCNENLDNESTDITQSSIICLGKVDQETITVDSSFEGITQHEDPKTQASNDSTDTDSDENDLEEVPEESDAAKPVVQLVLDDCNEVPEDDIFADIFESTQNPPSKVPPPNTLKSGEIYFKNMSEESAAAKPVQLVLRDCNEAPEDDIFADIFENTQKSSSEVIPPNKVMSPKAQNMQDTDVRKTETIEHSTISSSKFQCPKGKNMTDIVTPKTNVESVNESTIFKQKQSKVTENIQSVVDNPVVTRETISNETLLNKSLENDNDSIKATNSKSPDQSKIKQVENNKQSTNETIRPIMAPISEEQLNTMAEELQVEEQDLMQQKGRLDRIGRNITDQMTKEAQELLQIFGIPYIVAPMEAEAQCAFLESVKLTDGTITDDSDIWLFGGRTVYKNFFNQKKHVLQYLSERIERSFNLSREQLVLLALLVGSDYTTGVAGVGPVTALEILASFPFNKKEYQNENSKQSRYTQVITGLQEFKKWTRTGKRTDNTTLKKKLRNVNVGDDFPSVRVVQAYLDPNVEKSEENFTWGDLDITVLRDYTRAKFGWSQNKLDEIINPVLKRLKDRKTQKTVEDYFKKKIDIQALQDQMSKRVKAAVNKMETGSELQQEEKPVKGGRKRKAANNKLKESDNVRAGPSNAKQIKNNDEANVLKGLGVKVISHMQDDKSTFQIDIPKSDRVQEIIPQREKDKQCLLQNKMKAIELFRKTKIDKKKKPTKRRPNLPKAEAELSESSDSN